MWSRLRVGHRGLLALGASALTLQLSSSHANAAALTSSSPNLRTLHEVLCTSPIGRKYAKASPLGGSLWELTFAAQDLRTKSKSVQSQIVDLDHLDRPYIATLPADAGTTVTRSTKHGLEFRQSTCEDGKKLAVEVWSSDGVRLARRVIDGVGPKPLSPGVFGAPKFSPSGSKVAFVAERTPAGASATGYWPPLKDEAKTESSKPKGSSEGTGTDKSESEGKGDGDGGLLVGKFALGDHRSTGEALLVHSSQIVAWDWQADTVCLLKGEDLLGEHDPSLPVGGVAMPSQPCFDSTEDGLIVACYLLPPWQPGISACLNRPTRLYHLTDLWGAGASAKVDVPTGRDTSGDNGDEASGGTAATAAASGKGRARAACLTPSLYFAHMPRLSPDGTTLAFAAHADEFRSHSTAFELRTMPWPPPPQEAGAAPSTASAEAASSAVLVPRVRGSPPTTDGSSFAGVFGFHDELASMAWLDAKTLIFHSIAGATKSTFTVSTAVPSPPVLPLRPPGCEDGSVELLGADGGTAIVQCSSMRRPPSVWAHRDGIWSRVLDIASLLELRDNDPKAQQVARDALERLSAARVEKVCLSRDKGGAEALCLLPAEAEAVTVPWVLKIHGGPHSASLDAFNVEVALLVLSGVAVIQPNYRGSLGYGEAFCSALPGHIGEMDVADCVALTRASLAQLPDALDASRGAAYGGSHGGFLTAWLLGCEDRSLFARGGVLWNPVVDLPAMLGTTDIPEWCVQGG